MNRLLVGIACCVAFTCSVCSGQSISAPSSYVWERAIDTGRGCFEYQNCADDKWAFAIKPLVAYDKLHLIGQKSIWSSADGVTWTRQAKTDWGERYGMTLAHFDGKFWMTGGMRSWDRFDSEVWGSVDGRIWKLVSANAAWPGRRNHSVVVFDGRLWVIGGAISSGSLNQTPTRFYNDVWNSRDGIRWTRVTSNAAWSGRDNQQVLVFDNKLWLIGGTDHRDVWSSGNGKDWKQVTPSAPWHGRRGAGMVVYENKLWIFGGLEHNDVWSSTNGKDWQKVFDPAPWSTRGAEHSVAFRNAIWIFAGKTGRDDSWDESGDVWRMRTVPGAETSFKSRRIDISIPGFWKILFFLF